MTNEDFITQLKSKVLNIDGVFNLVTTPQIIVENETFTSDKVFKFDFPEGSIVFKNCTFSGLKNHTNCKFYFSECKIDNMEFTVGSLEIRDNIKINSIIIS